MNAGRTEGLRLFILRLRCAAAESRMTAALLALERHYRPDQPRVPAGAPEGGQWTSDGSAPARHVALAGNLIAQRVGAGEMGLIRICTYIDLLGRQYSFEQDAIRLCPPTYKAPPL